MYETIDIENRKHKPPLSVIRIIGEILTGLTFGTVSLLLVLHIGFWLIGPNEIGLLFLVIFIACSPLLFGIGCAAGVYLIGSIGQQTGSFSISLIGGFVVGLVVLLPSISLRVIGNLVPLLVLIIPPIPATICFNLSRRYKKPKPAIH